MKNKKPFYFFFLSLLLISINTPELFALEITFDNEGDIANWNIEGGHKLTRTKRGTLKVQGGNMIKIFSPKNLDFPSTNTTFEFSVKVPTENFPAFVSFQTVNNKIWKKSFFFRIPYKFNTYSINLPEVVKSGAKIKSFYFSFADVNDIEIDYIRTTSPSFIKSFLLTVKSFMQFSDIKGSTINFIYSPSFGKIPLMYALYILLLLLSALLTLIIWHSEKRISIQKPFVVASIIIGLLFIARMDYKWLLVCLHDTGLILDTAREKRISLLKGGGLDRLAHKLKQVIPDEERVKIISTDQFVALRLKYFLLPRLVSDKGNYILVHGSKNIRFDPVKKVLRRNDTIINKGVTKVANYTNGVALYKTNKGK